MTTDAVALDLRAEATKLLGPLADLAAPVKPGSEAPWDQLVRIGEHQVRKAATCGASLVWDGDFDGWRAAFARAHVARGVLERMRRGATLDPSTLAREYVVDAAEHGRDSLSQWLASLGPGGTAAVVRDATSFVIAARNAFNTWPPQDGTRFGDKYHWQVPGRAVRLEATVDAVTRPTRALLLLARAPTGHEQLDLAWPALVATLRTGQLPRTVTRIDLASGDRRRIPVTDDVLDTGLTAAATAVEAAMAARYTAPMEPTPGRWCARCAGADGACPVAHRR
jgi:hypothetical protein